MALQPIESLRSRFLISGIVTLLACGAITLLASKGLTSSLERLAKATDRIAAGELDAELPQNRSSGEVTALYQSVDAMATSIRQTIEHVSAQDKRTNAILDSTADGIVTMSESGKILSCNQSAERLFGYRSGEILGRSASILSQSLYEEDKQYERRDLASGQTQRIGDEYQIDGTRSDGVSIPLSLRVTEMHHDGEHIFIATLQDIGERKRAEQERARLFEGIREAVGSLSSASQELLASTSQQATSAQQQGASITETVTSVNEISETSAQAAQRAKEAGEAAEASVEAGTAGRRSVDDAIDAMGTARSQVDDIAANILSLADQAQAIGEIISAVTDIADQTNLLALNAAIEASRAGEHGKGFAVVASEIKALADQSKKATHQVGQILGEIQKATNAAVMSTENGTKAVNSATEVVGKAGDVIRDLAATLEHTSEAATQIVASASQQATGMSQVNHSMKHIEQATKQSIAAVRQVEATAQDLNALSTRLSELISEEATQDG